MRIVIRADASLNIGSGHVVRCLTLAELLARRGASVRFVTKNLPGNLIPVIQTKGFAPAVVPAGADVSHAEWQDPESGRDAEQTIAALADEPAPADWLIVDSYALGASWEHKVRDAARRIMVIDDLANRIHDCDLLLDQNYYADADRRYHSLVPAGCRLFLGPAFALLRDEFLEAARLRQPRDGTVRRLLVSFGATDPTDETGKVLTALRALSAPAFTTDVVVGAANPRRSDVAAQCATVPSVRVHVQTSDMAKLMAAADLAIGAGGSTMWERCALGLPALTVVTAPNQLLTTTDLAAAGAIWYLGRAEALAPTDYEIAIRTAMRSPARLLELSAHSRAIMESGAVASSTRRHPVVDAMLDALQGT